MRDIIDILEKYSADNSYFRSYMAGGPKFDYYKHWYYVCEWLIEHHPEEVEEVFHQEFDDPSDMMGAADPQDFLKFPEEIRTECAESVTSYILRNEPAEASTHEHMGLIKKQPLHRQTWLVHFSDHAYSIKQEGFRYGIDQMDSLGLTTYMGHGQKAYGGYNFAFKADSSDAAYACSQGKYGRDAVIFQNSGVECYHYGDQETQIVFHGADVDPRAIILLTQRDGDWQVKANHDMPNRDYLFHGDFEQCVDWVMQNHVQYRRMLY